jgi:hypothetical protein
MPLTVVLDSNIWLSEQILSTDAAVRFYCVGRRTHRDPGGSPMRGRGRNTPDVTRGTANACSRQL